MEGLPMAAPRLHAFVERCHGHEGGFRVPAGWYPRKILADCTGGVPWLPHVQHRARGSVKARQCFTDGWNVDPSWCRQAGEGDFSPFVPENFCTPPNVVEAENVLDLMFVERELREVGEVEVDPAATSSGSDLEPLRPPPHG